MNKPKTVTTPKLSQNRMSELKETKKMKAIALYEQTPKLFEPDPNPKNSLLFCPQKTKKNYPKFKSKSNVRIERNKENESFSTT